MTAVELFSRKRWLLVGIAATLSGVLAVLAVRTHIAESVAARAPAPAPVVESVEVVVAKTDLRAGEVVSEVTMASRRMPIDLVPSQAVRAEQFEERRGGRLLGSLKAGDLLLVSNLHRGENATIASQLAPGVRALTINVDEVNSISGLLQPGDRIDLHASIRRPETHSGSSSTAIELTSRVLEDIRILATGRQIRGGGSESSTRAFTAITVEVTPQQAQRLIVAQRHGRLTALLRPAGDATPTKPTTMDLAQALGLESRAAQAGSRAPVEIIEGGRGRLGSRSEADRASRNGPDGPVSPQTFTTLSR